MKILFITHHWQGNTHHSLHSGYQRLVYFFSRVNDITVLTWGEKNYEYSFDNIKIIVRKTPDRDYFFQRRLLLSWYARKIEKNYDIIHALYCELGILIKDKSKLITTIHVHPKIVRYNNFIQDFWLRTRWVLIDKRVIKRAKYNIVVSTNLLEVLKKIKIKNIGFIPHGVDTTFWNKKNIAEFKNEFVYDKKCKLKVLVIGFHGVNIKMLKNIIKEYKDIQFIVISKKIDLNANNLCIKSRISEEELKYWYNYVDVLFRPLNFSTANNSILESISMGTPIITNNIDGITDYLSVANSYLARDENDFHRIFSDLIIKKSSLNQRSKELSFLALNYSWENISKRIESLYSTIIYDNFYVTRPKISG